jgi:hypothetical protein
MDDQEWCDYREKHIKRLDVTTATDYAKQFGDQSLSLEDLQQEDINALESMTDLPQGAVGLKGFSRVYPRNDQDVMAVLANPRLKTEGISGSDNHELSTEDDMREREKICLETSYFNTKHTGTKFRKQIGKLGEAGIIDGVSIPTNPENISSEDVYLTNFYKFATNEDKQIPEWALSPDSISFDMLTKEIEHVDPSVIIAFGGKTWYQVFQDAVSKTQATAEYTDSEPSTLGLTAAAGLTFHDTRFNTTVIPLIHPAGGNVYDPIWRLT